MKKYTYHIYPKLSSARAQMIWDPTWFCSGIHVEWTNEVLNESDCRVEYSMPAGTVRSMFAILKEDTFVAYMLHMHISS